MLKRFKIKDERIEKEANKIYEKAYPLVMVLITIEAILKYMFLTQEYKHYTLEALAIVGSLGYLVIRSKISGIPLLKNNDECVGEVQNSYRAHSFNICFVIFITGAFIWTVLFDNIIIGAVYSAVWFIPALIVSIKVIRKGLLIWGSKKVRKDGIKSFKRNLVIGSLFYGLVVGWGHMFENNTFNPKGLLWVVGMAIGWGVPFYFIMNLFINKSEKRANNQVVCSEKESGSQIGEDYEE